MADSTEYDFRRTNHQRRVVLEGPAAVEVYVSVGNLFNFTENDMVFLGDLTAAIESACAIYETLLHQKRTHETAEPRSPYTETAAEPAHTHHAWDDDCERQHSVSHHMWEQRQNAVRQEDQLRRDEPRRHHRFDGCTDRQVFDDPSAHGLYWVPDVESPGGGEGHFEPINAAADVPVRPPFSYRTEDGETYELHWPPPGKVWVWTAAHGWELVDA